MIAPTSFGLESNYLSTSDEQTTNLNSVIIYSLMFLFELHHGIRVSGSF
jgi:hypothetical protein